MTSDDVAVSVLTPGEIDPSLEALSVLLHDCVLAGASVNFITPFGIDDSRAFWKDKVRAPALSGRLFVLVARTGGTIIGTVQLDTDMPPNQAHRGEVRKLLVHPQVRRRGIARLLMAELEHLARRTGRTLLTLDTRTGDSAEPLYGSIGYITAGTIPFYCRDVFEDRLHSTTLMYKRL